MLFEKRYVFQAHAVAVAAHILRIDKEPVRIDACFEGAAALPATGGCVRSQSPPREISDPRCGFLLSFHSASSMVTGDYADPQAAFEQTLAPCRDLGIPTRVTTETTVCRLDVQHRLTIDLISHRQIAEDSRDGKQMRFSAPVMPQISGVKIDGHDLLVDIDDTLLNIPTKQELGQRYKEDSGFRKEFAHCFLRRNDSGPPEEIHESNGYLVTSVVKSLQFAHGQPKGVKVEGNTVTLPGFGKIYFGELIVGGNSRRLTSVRLCMGSLTGGHMCLAESRPNGDELP